MEGGGEKEGGNEGGGGGGGKERGKDGGKAGKDGGTGVREGGLAHGGVWGRLIPVFGFGSGYGFVKVGGTGDKSRSGPFSESLRYGKRLCLLG